MVSTLSVLFKYRIRPFCIPFISVSLMFSDRYLYLFLEEDTVDIVCSQKKRKDDVHNFRNDTVILKALETHY